MAIILSAPTFNWSLTRERICDKALEKLNELGVGETASSSSRSLSFEALDGVLKTLQFQGLQWPRLSRGQSDFILFKGQQQQLLPADYYGFAEINFINQQANADGTFPTAPANEVALFPLLPAEWHEIANKADTADFPRCWFIDNANVLWIWPIPTQNVACRMFYQKVIEDSRAGASPQLRSPWMLALPYGVAVEMMEEFEVSDAKAKRLTAKWAYYLDLCLMNEAPAEHFDVTVRT